MKPQYAEWIAANVAEAYGNCKEITQAMEDAFPFELKRVRGHYYCPIWGERAHWWLIDLDDNSVVDPTAGQFPTKGTGQYVEWDDGAEEPTGMCPNCGEHSYGGNYFCGENCGIEYRAYVMGAIR